MDKNQIGLTGEYYVLAQLTHRGYIGTLTLGQTKGVDIVVTNAKLNTFYKVEVKTTGIAPKKEKLFGDCLFYKWQMSKKHETQNDPNLIYCFVYLAGLDQLPKFFIVPSRKVAEYMKKQHKKWLNAPHKKPVKDTEKRMFRIEESDPSRYEDNWELFS